MITNGIIYVVLLILVLGILFTGYFRMYLTETQFISALAAISVIAGVRQFSWLVVFQYRWNLLRLEEVKKFELEEGMYQLCWLTHFLILYFFHIKHEYLRSRAYICLSLSSSSSSPSSPVVIQIWPLSRYSCFYLGSLLPRNFCLEILNTQSPDQVFSQLAQLQTSAA